MQTPVTCTNTHESSMDSTNKATASGLIAIVFSVVRCVHIINVSLHDAISGAASVRAVHMYTNNLECLAP